MGKVTSTDGTAVAGATVSVKPLPGEKSSTVSTDRKGAFRIERLAPGRYTIEIHCPKCGDEISKQAEIAGDETVEVNFVVAAASNEHTPSGGALGPARLDTGSPYQQSQLKNPSGGGGYSNSASAQTDALYQQYLQKSALPKPDQAASGLQESNPPGTGEATAVEREGKELLAKGKYQDAIQVFLRGANQNPRSAGIQEGLGVSYFGAGRYGEAVGAFLQASNLAPDDSRLMIELSEAAGFAPDPSAARRLSNFVDAHPQSAAGHYAMGYYEWKRYEPGHNPASLNTARAHFENAVALEPGDAPARLYLGMTDDELGRTREAVENYKAAIAADPLLATVHYRLARDYQRLGETARAAEEFAQFQRLSSSNPPE